MEPNKNYKGGYNKLPFNKDGQNKGTPDIEERAKYFVPAIKKMLYLEEATTEEIKAGVSMTEELIKSYKKEIITAHQVRNIYSLILDIKTSSKPSNELQKLRPKLAYIGARQRSEHGKIVVKVIDLVIQSFDEVDVKVEDKINNLVYIMECIVAYQKFYSKN
jgi:CRISPR type III-A-associated protein Csm2